MLRPMYVNQSDMFIEAECTRNIKAYNGPLDVVVDIGAHIGYFTFAAINKGAREVWAFEPQPQNYHKLVGNICANYLLGSVIPVPLAVGGEVPGVFSLGKAGQNDGQNGLMMKAGMTSPFVARSVGVRQLLGILPARIDYLKMDVEGAEYLIFSDLSAAAVLMERVAYLEIELHDPSTYIELDSEKIPEMFRRAPAATLIQLLQDWGFSENAEEAKTLNRITSRNLMRSE